MDGGAAHTTCEHKSYEPDPNLVCSICLSVFNHPRRTPCGHVFCCSCLESAITHAGHRCPECRAPTELAEVVPDRLAAALVANLRVPCHFPGCRWVGRRGDVAHHVALRCEHAVVRCPGCDAEVPRGGLEAHRRECAGPLAECPWGCGERPACLEEHRSTCLLEPQRLLAAISALSAENARLTRDNLELRAQVDDDHGGAGGGRGGPRTPSKRKQRSGPGLCAD